MPRERTNDAPPPVMTWRKAIPVLVLAGIFDALRFIFEWFVFFGPAFAGVACTYFTGGSVASGVICGVAATVGGAWGAPAIETFGIVMAMAVGLIGWLIVGIILLTKNRRIFAENLLWFVGALFVSEVPLVGSVPSMTIALWKMYSNQIKIEAAAFKAYQVASAARLKRQREEAVQQALLSQAANEEAEEEKEAADDEEYEIPEGERTAA